MSDKLFPNESRRRFIIRSPLLAVALPSLCLNSSCQAQSYQQQRSEASIVGGSCEGCEGIYEGMPRQLSWQAAIAPASEPGERLEMSGVIYRADGKTPAPGVVLYVYQTDATGHYTPAPGASGHARRHGRLRGWMKTNAGGEYKFTTVRPAPYPSRDTPAHVHPIIKEPDKNEYYIDEYVFDDDPLLTQARRAELDNIGGSGVVRLTRGPDGVWNGKRDIILGLNVSNYR